MSLHTPYYKVGDQVEYLLHTQPDKWRKAEVLYIQENTIIPTYTLKSENGVITQQLEGNIRSQNQEVK